LLPRPRHLAAGDGARLACRRHQRLPQSAAERAAMSAPLLQVDNLETRFFTPAGIIRAVDGVSLHVAAGEAIGIVGESGSGKSLTALSILRLVPSPGRITGGAVHLDGRDLLSLSEAEMRDIRRRDMAMIFQDAGAYLNPIMPIGLQLAEAIGKNSL